MADDMACCAIEMMSMGASRFDIARPEQLIYAITLLQEKIMREPRSLLKTLNVE
jgi:NADH:ubiquinone oxidoreductase subunit B-like Fe-S oxidoreductase